MRFATINIEGSAVAAVYTNDGGLLQIAKAASLMSEKLHPSLYTGDLQTLISSGDEALAGVQSLLLQANSSPLSDARHSTEVSVLMAPIPVPRKNVFCVGRNYAEHIAEGARAQNTTIAVTEHPVFFTKPLTAVIGPDESIPLFSEISQAIDYEVELAIVIGKAGRNIKLEDAYDHVFGYTIVNDVTARDVQRRHGGQYFKGKALDGSCPVGPSIVTADSIENPHDLGIRLWVNGELRQDGNTRDMIFDIPALIASLSEGLTLEPGDIVATGTPSGVGYAMDPPCFLGDGDTVVCEIDHIGRLQNTVRTA